MTLGPSSGPDRMADRKISRRLLFGVGGALGVSAVSGLLANAGRPKAVTPVLARIKETRLDPFDHLRLRWRDGITGSAKVNTGDPDFAARLAAIGQRARHLWRTMTPTAAQLWPDATLGAGRPSINVHNTFHRLSYLALGHALPGTGLTGQGDLASAVIRGLDFMYERSYNERQTFYDNWWDWQVGSARSLIDICVLMHDQLSDDRLASYVRAIDHFCADPTRILQDRTISTGANRVWFCETVALSGMLGRDAAKLATARAALSPVFATVTRGDGFHSDGTFIQHDSIPQNGGYGVHLLQNLAEMITWLHGSPWAVTDPGLTNLFDAIELAFVPFVYNGLMMDCVRGRSFSRPADTDYTNGHWVAVALLQLAEAAPPGQGTWWRRLAKGWLQRSGRAPFMADEEVSLAGLVRGKALLADRGVLAEPEAVRHHHFHDMNRVVHRRPGWAASISMCSTSAGIAYYEAGNGENPYGWHTGNGAILTYTAERPDRYFDLFWPTVDYYRIPGTTVSAKALAPFAGRNTIPRTAWVGGATDDEFGAVGMDTRAIDSTLVAKKAWFCVDDAIVHLGAAITARDGTRVETVLDNVNLGAGGANALTVDGLEQPTAEDWSATLNGPQWMHVNGVGGFVLGSSQTVAASRSVRTGNWQRVNSLFPEATDRTRHYLTLAVDHGTNPTDAAYVYVQMPAATLAQTAARAADSTWLTVLANTTDQQGIHIPSLGLLAVNFYRSGSLAGLTVSAPACVLVRQHAGVATVCVSDPQRSATTIDLVWYQPISDVRRYDPTVTVLGIDGQLSLRVDVRNSRGATHQITVSLPENAD